MDVKPLNFNSPPNLVDPTFYHGFHPLPKTSQTTYLGIPFDESLALKPIVSMLNSKINYRHYILNSHFSFICS